MPLCQYKHLNVHYTETGEGRVIVLLHGFLEDLTMWHDYTNELRKRYRVVCIDLLGHGQTDCHGYVHTMNDMAGAVNAVLKYLHVRRYIMIGHSMGGYVALAYGELFPDNLIGLGLFYSTPKADSEEKKELRLRAIETAKTRKDLFIKTSIPNLFYEGSITTFKSEIENLIKRATTMTTQGIVAALAGMRERPDRDVLLHFGPYAVMVINGERDGLIPIDLMKTIMKLPRVTHALVTPNGHMGHIEDRDACLKMIKRFIIDTHEHHNSLPDW